MKKVIIVVLIIAAVCVSFYKYNNHSIRIDFKNNKYSSFVIDDFGKFSNLLCIESKSGTILFPSFTDTVIVSYTDKEFNNQIKNLNKFDYLEHIVLSNDKKYYIIADNKFFIGDWEFKVLNDNSYPNYINLVSVNRKDFKIAYLSFVDTEIDTMCSLEENANNDYMQKFIKKYFKYKFD